jgi:hypothetical protein
MSRAAAIREGESMKRGLATFLITVTFLCSSILAQQTARPSESRQLGKGGEGAELVRTATTGRSSGTLILRERFGVSHPRQLVEFALDQDIHPKAGMLKHADGQGTPYQVLSTKRIVLMTDLPADSAREWDLASARPAAEGEIHHAVVVTQNATRAIVENGLTGVVVPGLGETAGQAIGRHMDVDMVAFTGSTEVGRYFLKYAAESNLKRIILECGGKSPQVVFEDAPDLDTVANNAVGAAFWNMGENCSCGSRLIMHKRIKDGLVARIAKLAKTWKVGDPLDPQNRLGAMIEKPHLEKVLGYIEAGKADGAKLILGGRRILEKTGGYFVEVTIFDEVSNQMKIAREEIFGPVLSVIPFSTEDEAIALANDTNYGLAASFYTRDFNRAHRVARAIRAGTVSVNCFSEGDITTPFGGFKQSGFFGRDKSIWAHQQYTELKTIWMQLA